MTSTTSASTTISPVIFAFNRSSTRSNIEFVHEDGFGNLPICIAKTQCSFSIE
jgi:formyltetrahydrofolate synthetase